MRSSTTDNARRSKNHTGDVGPPETDEPESQPHDAEKQAELLSKHEIEEFVKQRNFDQLFQRIRSGFGQHPRANQFAEDVISEADLQLIKAIGRPVGDVGAYYWRIIKNIQNRTYSTRYRDKQIHVLEAEMPHSSESGFNMREVPDEKYPHERYDKAHELPDLSKLTESERQMITDHFWNDKSLKEIAKEASVRPSTMRSRFAKCLSKLRAHTDNANFDLR